MIGMTKTKEIMLMNNEELTNLSVKDIREIPEHTLNFLYTLRLFDDVSVPYEEYVKRFDFVVIDDVIYHDGSESCKQREKQYLEALKTPKSVKIAQIPSVVIKIGLVEKNRFGHTSYG